jgi:hypothetical protein
VLGYVFDQAQGGLRPIRGIPGAARLGEVLPLGRKLSRAQVAAGQSHALAVTADTQEVVLLTFGAGRGGALLRPIAGAALGIGQLALSPTGTAAALLDSGRRSVQVITGLPQAPSVAAQVDVSAWPGPFTAMGISDDAGAVLLAASAGGSGALYALGRSGEVRSVSSLGQASAITFLGRSQDALVADRQADEVLLVRDVLGAAARQVLAGQREGVSGPLAVEASEDNQRVFIANSGSKSVTTLELATGLTAHLSSDREVAGLYRLRGDSVFRLTELTGEPLLLLEGGAGEARLLFVPAVRATAEPAGGLVLPDRGQSRPLRTRDRRTKP